MHEISVVIPTYNREKHIKKSIESVLAQKADHERFEIREIIVVDDHSTDNTQEIIDSISDPRIKYIYQKENGGPGAARNKGVDIAKYEWIAFHDSDDIWVSDKLLKQVTYIDEHPGCEMVCGSTKQTYNGQTTIMVLPEEYNEVGFFATKNYVDAPTILIKKERFLSIGGFDVDLKALEDWDFGLRYADIYRIGFVNEILIEKTPLDGGVSSHVGNYFEARCRIITKNREILERHGCFEKAMEHLLIIADQAGVLKETAAMLELYLTI